MTSFAGHNYRPCCCRPCQMHFFSDFDRAPVIFVDFLSGLCFSTKSTLDEWEAELEEEFCLMRSLRCFLGSNWRQCELCFVALFSSIQRLSRMSSAQFPWHTVRYSLALVQVYSWVRKQLCSVRREGSISSSTRLVLVRSRHRTSQGVKVDSAVAD